MEPTGEKLGLNNVFFLTRDTHIINMYDDSEHLLNVSDVLDPKTGEWYTFAPYYFSDGTLNPPALLRTTPEQNYLTDGVRSMGLSLASIAMLVILISVTWVFFYRSHSVVIAAQPPFLYVLCLGSLLTTSSIYISSFDEGTGWDDAMLDRACITIPWLLSLGHIVTYSALFTKVCILPRTVAFISHSFII